MFRTASLIVLALVLGITPAKAQTSAPKPAASAARSTTPLNLNTATAAQLEELPGIGRATADRIIEFRQKSGGFKKPEELMNVRGVGEKSFLKLKPLVTVGTAKSEKVQE